MSRKLLQVATAILSLIPIATGIVAMTGVDDPLYASLNLPQSPVLDSNLRFFGGVWLGLGVAMLYPTSIERRTVLFRALWGAVFLGGIGRALSAVFVGLPPGPFYWLPALEIIGAPLFVFWQNRWSVPIVPRTRHQLLGFRLAPE
jgi:hypothetical protein